MKKQFSISAGYPQGDTGLCCLRFKTARRFMVMCKVCCLFSLYSAAYDSITQRPKI
jgi:hypothetical protein